MDKTNEEIRKMLDNQRKEKIMEEGYKDAYGHPVSLESLVMEEPQWAANVIRQWKSKYLAAEAAHREEVSALVGALKFYATYSNWEQQITNGESEVSMDCGCIAEEAVKNYTHCGARGPVSENADDSWNTRHPLFTTHPTPPEWEDKTGQKLGDGDAVWVYMEGWEEADKNAWELVKYGIIGWENPIVVVAIPGLSAPDNSWRPE